MLPLPANALTDFYDSVAYSVSCPQDGSCVAVGDYLDLFPSGAPGYQNGLIEVLSGGTWTATEAQLPTGPESGGINLYSVSCSDVADCVIAGSEQNYIDNSGPDAYLGLIYTLSFGIWQVQVAPVPNHYNNSIQLNSVSCPTSDDCVIVGSYQDWHDYQYGLILSLSGGVWSAMTGPVPANAATTPSTQPDEDYGSGLNSVDCPDSDTCVAGGLYVDKDYYSQPLLVQLGSGRWTPTEAPVPPDSQANPIADILGVYCPASGSCLATGEYFIDFDIDQSGMILTQSGGAWSVMPAPIPDTFMGGLLNAGSKRRADSESTASISSVTGVSCSTDGLCAAGGNIDSSALLETGQASVPEVTGVVPPTGPLAGGTTATITGTGFTSTTTVKFGRYPATSTTFVSSDELQAVSPPGGYGAVDVTVSSNGMTTRANGSDTFSYQSTTSQATSLSVTASYAPMVTYEPVTYTVTVSPAPDGGTVSLSDGFGPIAKCRNLTLVAGTVSCSRTYTAFPAHETSDAPFQIVARFSGDPNYEPSAGDLAMALLRSPVITTSTLPIATVKMHYRTHLVAVGKGPFRWKVTSGSLPKEISLTTSGILEGHPRTTGAFRFIVTVTDSALPRHHDESVSLTMSVDS